MTDAVPLRRVGLDANTLLAGILWPRWSFEIVIAALERRYVLILPERVLAQARSHLELARDREALNLLLRESLCEIIANPTREEVDRNIDLVRSRNDVAIGLALLAARAEILVTNDRDFTDEGAVAERFRQRIEVMLPPVFLRDVMGWTSADLETIRHREWKDITTPDG